MAVASNTAYTTDWTQGGGLGGLEFGGSSQPVPQNLPKSPANNLARVVIRVAADVKSVAQTANTNYLKCRWIEK